MTANRVLALVAGALGALALFGGDTPAPGGPGAISALEVARALRADPDGIRLLDIRDAAAFEEFHLPRAARAPADPGALVAGLATDVGPGDAIVVLGGPDAAARLAWLALRRAGFVRARYLPDATSAWLADIVSPVLPADAGPARRAAWPEQAELSRYFGGFPRVGTAAGRETDAAADGLRRARRRGCAF